MIETNLVHNECAKMNYAHEYCSCP